MLLFFFHFDPLGVASLGATPPAPACHPVQVLRSRVEEVIEECNAAMEASQARVERLGEAVRREAAAVVAGVQEAEGRRQGELATRVGAIVEKLEGHLERMVEEEERMRTFASSLELFGKDLAM